MTLATTENHKSKRNASPQKGRGNGARGEQSVMSADRARHRHHIISRNSAANFEDNADGEASLRDPDL